MSLQLRKRGWLGGLRWILVCASVISLSAFAPRTQSAVASMAPYWHGCSYAAGYQCADLTVPLDYARPDGQKIEIAVIRHLATDPARRIGSLIVNPGGPGGPGTVVLPLMYGLLPLAVRERYDVVSFDPRGVGRSDGLKCFANQIAENAMLGQWAAGFPVGSAQVFSLEQTYLRFDQQCARSGGPVLAHMSTADVARDMDVIRHALGEQLLNYYGISYGTILGAVYANLFPGRTGNMVLDGNVSPLAWADGDADVPTALRMGSDSASAATLRSFLQLCGRAAVHGCAFSAGSPAATSARYATLLTRLRSHPVTAGSQSYTYAGTVSAVDDFLYTTSAEPSIGEMGWKAGAQLLESIWDASRRRAGTARAKAGSSPGAAASSAQPYNGNEQELGVECADSPDPADPAAYATQAALAARKSGAFGPMWAWRTEPCASWPGDGDDRYTGPWNRSTARPVLVIGNTGDPATPYVDAVTMSKVLARGRLLTVDQFGHTALLNRDTCASGYVTRYLLTATLPRAGTVCAQTTQPFVAGGQ